MSGLLLFIKNRMEFLGYNQADLRNEMNALCSRNYSKSKIQRHLDGKARIYNDDLECYKEVLAAEDNEICAKFDTLYRVYQFWYDNKDKKEYQAAESFINVFQTFQQLAGRNQSNVLYAEPKYRAKDGVISAIGEVQDAIRVELLREYFQAESKIEVFLPQDFPFYYNEIKNILYAMPKEQKIRIRQIISTATSKKDSEIGEFELSTFLSDMIFLLFAHSGSYQFYYSGANGKIREFNGLVYPYYICTSTCLIRLSSALDSAWVTHDKSVIKLYHDCFDAQIKQEGVRPLVRELQNLSNFLQYRKEHTHHNECCITPQPCFIELVPNDTVSTFLVPNDNQAIVSQVASYAQALHEFLSDKSKSYFTKNGLDVFVKSGVMLEYPQDIVRPANVDERILMLNMLRERVQNQNSLANLMIKEPVKNLDFCISAGTRYILIHPQGFEDYDFLVIEDPNLVETAAYLFQDYLANSEMVYSSEETIRYIDECISLLKSNQFSEE